MFRVARTPQLPTLPFPPNPTPPIGGNLSSLSYPYYGFLTPWAGHTPHPTTILPISLGLPILTHQAFPFYPL